MRGTKDELNVRLMLKSEMLGIILFRISLKIFAKKGKRLIGRKDQYNYILVYISQSNKTL